MACYSLDCFIIHTSHAKCQEVLGALPSLPSLQGVEPLFEKSGIAQAEDGVNYQCSCMIRFNNDTDRESFWSSVEAVEEFCSKHPEFENVPMAEIYMLSKEPNGYLWRRTDGLNLYDRLKRNNK